MNFNPTHYYYWILDSVEGDEESNKHLVNVVLLLCIVYWLLTIGRQFVTLCCDSCCCDSRPTGRRVARKSSAAGAAQRDTRPLLTILVILGIMYSVVTVVLYYKLSGNNNDNKVAEAVAIDTREIKELENILKMQQLEIETLQKEILQQQKSVKKELGQEQIMQQINPQLQQQQQQKHEQLVQEQVLLQQKLLQKKQLQQQQKQQNLNLNLNFNPGNVQQQPQLRGADDIPSGAANVNVNANANANAIQQLQHTFPIHGSDQEIIEHPGIMIAEKLPGKRKLPDNLPRNMAVPKFFDDTFGRIYGKTTIREYLGDGETLMSPEVAASIGSFYTNPTTGEELETIYCSIATYRDPECTGTVEDLYARADHPERIRVAIIDQHVMGDSNDPICSQPAEPCESNPEQALCKYRHLIDAFPVDARLSVGPVFARHLAHRHYRGEYYAMQIDSHVRFTQHWDTDIIGQWKAAKNEMAVLTTYPSDINGSIEPGTYKNIRGVRPYMCQSDYEGQGQYKHLRHGQQPEAPPTIRGQPTLHPFWAAGFSFARGHFVIQVPYDQYLPMVFQGEEISIGLRGFTYGYDYYAPEQSVLFHMYAIKENEAKRKKVPLFWENGQLYSGVGQRTMKRLNSIIGMTGPYHYGDDEWDRDEIHKYGMGNIRQTKKFFDIFGIHPDTETVEHHLCYLVGIPMMRIFLPALRQNHMGIDYDLINYKYRDQWPDQPNSSRVNPQAAKQIMQEAAQIQPLATI